MCITIPSSAHVEKARQWGIWQWLAASPLRLYLIGGASMLTAFLAFELVGMKMLAGWGQFHLLFVIAPTLLLGVVFELLPRLLKVTPITYVRFASLFFLLLISQLAFLADAWLGQTPGSLYLLLLGLVWSLALLTLRGMLRLSYTRLAGMATALFHLLLLAGVVGLLIALGLESGWLPGLPAYTWIGLLPLYLFALLLLLYLHARADSIRPA